MKNIKLLACASLVTTFTIADAFAKKDYDDRLYISPTATYLGLDDDRMTSRSGHGLSLGLGKAMSQHINLEVKAIYNRYQHQSNDVNKYQWDTFGGALDLQYYFARKKFSPYVASSIGAMESNVSGRNAWGFIGDVGVGFNYEINDNISLRSDIRYRYNDNFNENITAGNRSRYNDMLVNVGFVIPLGSKPVEAPKPRPRPKPQPIVQEQPKPVEIINPDLDGDGVKNELDKCPNTPIGSIVNSQGCVVPAPSLKGINFKNNSAELDDSSKENLDQIAKSIIAYPKKSQIEVQGHTSSTGSDKYNLKLSQKRAQTVADHLKAQGVNNEIVVKGFGETTPVADNSTKEGRAINRRVAIILK